MKSRHIFFLLTGLLSFGAAAQVGPPAPNTPAAAPAVPGITLPAMAAPATNAPAEPPDKGQFSHALGVYYAQGVTNDMAQRKSGLDPHADLDLGKFFEAFSNVVVGAPMSTNMDELKKILAQEDAYQKQRIEEDVKKLTATGPENKVKGEKFMDDIAKQPGMTKLASGVVYKVIKDGDGEKPASTDAATVSFQAKKIDGTEVWKIEHQGIPVTHQLIPPGLTEAMTMMKAGSHWTVYLPYTQAYGEKPAIADPKHGYKVGPESALIFDVEVEAVQKRPPLPPTRMPQGLTPGAPAAAAPGATASPVVTSGIVRVPSAEEMEKGDKPRVMTDAEIEALKKGQTNAPSPK